MEEAVAKVEAMFQRAESDADNISRKLDVAFKADVSEDALDKMNPREVLEKLSDIRKEYASLVEEAESVKTAQKEAAVFFRGELMTLCDTLSSLQQTTQGQSDKSEELKELEGLVGRVTLDTNTQSHGDGVDSGGEMASAFNLQHIPDTTCTTSDSERPATTAETSCVTSIPEISASERRLNSTEIVDIDQQEFESVSTLVRGRVKLVEVNHTYHILWQHFKEERNSQFLTIAEMQKMGMRITGKTGEAKLKVLKTLKLLQINKNGSVKLV